MSDHARFSPSAASRWLACHASWRLSEEMHTAEKDEVAVSSNAAKEGTCAHQLAELSLQKGINPTQFVGKTITTEIDGEPHDFVVSDDMARHVEVYYDHCQTLAMLADRQFIEVRVHVPLTVHGVPTKEELHGTMDYGTISGNRIDIVDLKYGTNPVSPEENPQAIAYLLGAIEVARETGYDITEAGIHICQPRQQREVKTWEVPNLQAFVADWTKKFEKAIERCIEVVQPPLASQYSVGQHCHFCPKIATCSHFAEFAIEQAAKDLDRLESADPDGDPGVDVLVQRLQMQKTVKRYYEELEKFLRRRYLAGEEVPGYKVVKAIGNRRWTLDDEIMAKKMYNKGIRKPDLYTQKLISPAKAEKFIDDEKFFKKYVERPVKGDVLVPATDKRPAVPIAVNEIESLIEEVNEEINEEVKEEDVDLSML